MGELKELRNEKKLTQQQVADLVGVSLRSYISYENDERKEGTSSIKTWKSVYYMINVILSIIVTGIRRN